VNSIESIAVLLAAYNGMEYIDEQLKSIFTQENIAVQVFISVDLSTDGTYEYCKDLEKKDKRITVLEYGEIFGGAGKNFFRLIRVVDFSSFDYVAFADQDDIWLPTKLSKAVSMIEKKNVGAYSSDITAFWPDGRKALIKKSYPQRKYDYLFEAAGPGCTYVFKSSSLACFKLFLIANEKEVNQVRMHDWMIYAFFRANDMQWHIDDFSSMLYRQHASNQVGSNSGFLAMKKRFMMIQNHWYRNEVEKITHLLSKYNSDFSLDRLYLLKHWHELRRKSRERWVLLFFILFGVF